MPIIFRSRFYNLILIKKQKYNVSLSNYVRKYTKGDLK